MTPIVLKLGGELLETPAQRARIAGLAGAIARARTLVVVHGGGRAVDAELARRQVVSQKVDGLRITGADTLEVVISVLAGSANTALVAALVTEGVPAVGLTGIDAGFGRAVRSNSHRAADGTVADLGLVGDPVDADPSLLRLLVDHRYVPIVASIGLEERTVDTPTILNVNADVMACRIAAALAPCDLVVAGGTPGVLDDAGRSIPFLDSNGIDAVIASGTATRGMVAKLSACRTALLASVASARIVDGRQLDATHDIDTAPGTMLSLAPAVAGTPQSGTSHETAGVKGHKEPR